MLRGFFSGAFWGLLVGAVTLVVAALVIEARQTPRQGAEAPMPVVEAPDAPEVDVDQALMRAPDVQSPGLHAAPGPRPLVPRPGKPVLPDAPLLAAGPKALAPELPDRPVAMPPLPGGPSGDALDLVVAAPEPDGVGVNTRTEAGGPIHAVPGPGRPLVAGMPPSPEPLSPPQNGPGALPPPALVASEPAPGAPLAVAARPSLADDTPRAPDPARPEPAAAASDAVATPAAPLSAALAGRHGGYIAFVGAGIEGNAPEWMLSALAGPGLPEGMEPVAASGLDVITTLDAAVALADPARAAAQPGTAPLYRRIARVEDASPQTLAAIAERAHRDGHVAVLVDAGNAAVLEVVAAWLATGGGADLTPVPLSFLIR